MKVGLFQSNLNHCRRAQDLFIQTLMEWRCGIGIATEPYKVPEGHPCWSGDEIGSVAITWMNVEGSLPCTNIGKGRIYVAVE